MKAQNKAMFVLGLLFALAVCSAGRTQDLPKEDAPDRPPRIIDHLGSKLIPVHASSVTQASYPDFRLVRLPDGHDYWLLRERSGDTGYSALAHTPECAKCVARKK